ncbi:hypothetical protein E4T43_06269 [Aureobasidium subglaciale]|nr:hypothetical protein E4T43_06269 [Aureobasidium subglaciale]
MSLVQSATTLPIVLPADAPNVRSKSTPEWTIPSSTWEALCHPRVDEVSEEVDGYFLKHWPFPNAKAEKTFIGAGFSRVTCLYFPLAKDDRIHFACRLLTVLFLIDDVLEDMSFEEGEAYNARLMPIARGHVSPDRSKPVEYIFYDLWKSMRDHDEELANEVLEPVFTFMRAQTDRTRLQITELGRYLEYRERDVGKALLSALMRFSMDLHLTGEELFTMSSVEQNCSKQISVVNDIYSWEKELLASQHGHKEGSALCSAVQVLAGSAGINIEAAKRVLWAMTREWEREHDAMYNKAIAEGCSASVNAYIKGLEYQMSGNELWSRTTLRYKMK